VSSELTVTAPVSGTITSRATNPGEVVEASKELMRVTDLANVWVIAQVYEKDTARLREGSGASVTTDALPGVLLRGRVTYIDPNIKPETRTVQVRVELENPGRKLKIGMYVSAALGSMGVAERTMPSVPASAVQTIGASQFVFLPTDEPNKFALRPVRLGEEKDGQLPVVEGLNVGDRVVANGSFLLRAEWVKQHP
jgi:RND family efflux transporter MFP subunit